jgi:putative flavoprotein involved in K+ transport
MSATDIDLDVIVVGGGQAGLAMAWHLRRLGMTFAVLDAGPEVGHVWRSRWDSLRLFTAARYDGLPGLAFPGDPDRYPTKDEVADYLQAYVARFDLPVRCDSRVATVRRCHDGYEVTTARETLRARQVVLATGPFPTPAIPSVAAGLAPVVTQVHSAQYRRPQDLPVGPVLVVGGGNSGRQIAHELAATRQVDLAVGARPAVVPQRLLGRDLFWWLTRLGVVTAPADSRFGRRMRAREELVVGTTDRMLRQAGVTLRPRVTGADGTTVRFADGSALQVDTVVWATGFRPDHSWCAVDSVLGADGPVHQRGVTPAPGLYVLGMPWQHSRGSALLGFVGDDAAYLAGRIADQAAAHRTPWNHRCDEPAADTNLDATVPPARSTR